MMEEDLTRILRDNVSGVLRRLRPDDDKTIVAYYSAVRRSHDEESLTHVVAREPVICIDVKAAANAIKFVKRNSMPREKFLALSVLEACCEEERCAEFDSLNCLSCAKCHIVFERLAELITNAQRKFAIVQKESSSTSLVDELAALIACGERLRSTGQSEDPRCKQTTNDACDRCEEYCKLLENIAELSERVLASLRK